MRKQKQKQKHSQIERKSTRENVARREGMNTRRHAGRKTIVDTSAADKKVKKTEDSVTKADQSNEVSRPVAMIESSFIKKALISSGDLRSPGRSAGKKRKCNSRTVNDNEAKKRKASADGSDNDGGPKTGLDAGSDHQAVGCDRWPAGSDHDRQSRLERLADYGGAERPDEFYNQSSAFSGDSQADSEESDIAFEPFRSFKLSEDKVLVVTDHPNVIRFHGKVQLRVLRGSVCVLGYNVTPSATYRLYSPTSASCLTITTNRVDCPSIETGSEDPEPYNDAFEYLTPREGQKFKVQIREFCTNRSTLLLFKSLTDRVTDFVSLYYPSLLSLPSSDDGRPGCESLREIGIHAFHQGEPLRSWRASREYDKVTDIWTRELACGECPPIAVVCGGKNVGKSTFARYLLNVSLNSVPKVSFLECDIGQTEFTPPGCVSLTTVTGPLLGPPYTHQDKMKDTACFFGSVNAQDDPTFYLECVEFVLSRYNGKTPLIVNTMGWNKGIGLQLLVDLLRRLRPTYVVQLESRNQSKNLPPISAEYVRESAGWKSGASAGNAGKTDGWEDYRHKLVVVDSMAPLHKDYVDQRQFGAPDQRNMALLSTLSTILPPQEPIGADTNLNGVRPVRIPWSRVAVHVCHASVPRSQTLHALNGTLVALCRVDSGRVIPKDGASLPMFLDRTPACECIGFGIVRSIDPVCRVFYILPTVETDLLAEVNCLLRGGVNLPTQLLQKQEHNGCIPYLGKVGSSAGSSAVHGRTYRKRWRHQRGDEGGP